MNKNELIDLVAAKNAELPKAQVTRIVDAVFEGIASALKDGGEARFAGFGTFKVGHSAARTGRNPATGATIQIAASNKVKFTPGKELKDAVN